MSLSQVSVCLSCQHGIRPEFLLPHLAGVVVEGADLAGGRLCIWARADHGVCSRCGQPSGRVHSMYGRRLADAPAGGRRVLVRLAVRRTFCGNPDCPKKTFAEQARRTGLLPGAGQLAFIDIDSRSGGTGPQVHCGHSNQSAELMVANGAEFAACQRQL